MLYSDDSYNIEGCLSRDEAEELLLDGNGEQLKPNLGFFLIRDTNSMYSAMCPYVLSRIGLTDDSRPFLIHRKIKFSYQSLTYTLETTRTKSPAFKTLVRPLCRLDMHCHSAFRALFFFSSSSSLLIDFRLFILCCCLWYRQSNHIGRTCCPLSKASFF